MLQQNHYIGEPYDKYLFLAEVIGIVAMMIVGYGIFVFTKDLFKKSSSSEEDLAPMIEIFNSTEIRHVATSAAKSALDEYLKDLIEESPYLDRNNPPSTEDLEILIREYELIKYLMKNEAVKDVIKAEVEYQNKARPFPYITYLKGKNPIGERDMNVADCYFFYIKERYYYASCVDGEYLIPKTLNELEVELNPDQFLRLNREYIININYVLNYAYWGKVII
jgi:DNA-binding LytR/AlgR family response regulator